MYSYWHKPHCSAKRGKNGLDARRASRFVRGDLKTAISMTEYSCWIDAATCYAMHCMSHPPLVSALPTAQLIQRAIQLSAYAAMATTPETRQELNRLARRYRVLIAERQSRHEIATWH